MFNGVFFCVCITWYMRTVFHVVELDIFFPLFTSILACTHLCYVADTIQYKVA